MNSFIVSTWIHSHHRRESLKEAGNIPTDMKHDLSHTIQPGNSHRVTPTIAQEELSERSCHGRGGQKIKSKECKPEEGTRSWMEYEYSLGEREGEWYHRRGGGGEEREEGIQRVTRHSRSTKRSFTIQVSLARCSYFLSSTYKKSPQLQFKTATHSHTHMLKDASTSNCYYAAVYMHNTA